MPTRKRRRGPDREQQQFIRHPSYPLLVGELRAVLAEIPIDCQIEFVFPNDPVELMHWGGSARLYIDEIKLVADIPNDICLIHVKEMRPRR